MRCRGSTYPGFIPRPVLSELPLQPPFAEIDTEKAQLEANLFMWSNLQVEGVEKKFKEAALKSFAVRLLFLIFFQLYFSPFCVFKVSRFYMFN